MEPLKLLPMYMYFDNTAFLESFAGRSVELNRALKTQQLLLGAVVLIAAYALFATYQWQQVQREASSTFER